MEIAFAIGRSAQIYLSVVIDCEKGRQPAAVVEVVVGKYHKVDLAQVDSQLLRIRYKRAFCARIKQNLPFLMLDMEG